RIIHPAKVNIREGEESAGVRLIQSVDGLSQRLAPLPVEVDDRSDSGSVHLRQVPAHSLQREKLLPSAKVIVDIDDGKSRLLYPRHLFHHARARLPVL